jgi:hypothetical protein
MGIERHDGYWLWVGGPVAPGMAAITIGSVVLMRRRSVGNARLLRHELVHVRQYRDLGVPGFLVRYLWSYGRWRLRRHPHWSAYRRIPFEAEAEWVARRSSSPPSA